MTAAGRYDNSTKTHTARVLCNPARITQTVRPDARGEPEVIQRGARAPQLLRGDALKEGEGLVEALVIV